MKILGKLAKVANSHRKGGQYKYAHTKVGKEKFGGVLTERFHACGNMYVSSLKLTQQVSSRPFHIHPRDLHVRDYIVNIL